MADLENLLDEINNDVSEQEEDDVPERYEQPQDQSTSTMPSSIPAALTAAANRRDADPSQLEPEEGDAHLPDPEYEQLKSLWSQELACPELLPADADTVSLHVDLLEGQEETIDHLLERSKENGRRSGEASGELASLMAQITKMDLDRTRYMLVDLARTRMAKIENHALHNKTLVDRMTEEEVSSDLYLNLKLLCCNALTIHRLHLRLIGSLPSSIRRISGKTLPSHSSKSPSQRSMEEIRRTRND